MPGYCKTISCSEAPDPPPIPGNLTLLQHVLCFLYSKEEVCLVQKLKRKITTVITVSDFYFWFFFLQNLTSDSMLA